MADKVVFELTPNPATMKFILPFEILDKTFDFQSSQEAEKSPLASKIFGFPWTAAVFLGSNFVSVTKADWVDWDILAEPLAGIIGEHFERGEAVVYEFSEEDSGDDNLILETDEPIIKKIKTILKNEIKPIVALDGGDIGFKKYEDNVLYIQMKGACSGCPSSTATLKEGIEVRFKELIPEIKEVVSV